MPRVIAPRSLRPRQLLLPLLFGLLLLPALLRTTTVPAAEDGLHTARTAVGPMIDVPLAHVNDAPSDGDAPPAA